MEEGVRSNLEVQQERAVLVKVLLTREEKRDDDPLEELRALVDSAGGVVAGELLQQRERPHGASYLGKGKWHAAKQKLVVSVLLFLVN